MKKLILIALLTKSALATSVFTFESWQGQKFSVPYFYATDFNKNFQYCYDGEVNDVCHLVDLGSQMSKENYQDGGHDYFEVVTCVSNHEIINTKIRLFNDYDEGYREAEVNFGKCGM